MRQWPRFEGLNVTSVAERFSIKEGTGGAIGDFVREKDSARFGAFPDHHHSLESKSCSAPNHHPSVSALRRSRFLRTLNDANDDTRDVFGWKEEDMPDPIVGFRLGSQDIDIDIATLNVRCLSSITCISAAV
jgi:hypothetical protein